MKRIYFLILIFFNFIFFSKAEGAVLYFENSSDQYFLNDVFLIHLRINPEEERINAAKIEIIFPGDKLEVVEILKEDSIFSLWPEEPSIEEKGKISFVGGVPWGFDKDEKILSLAFRVISNKNDRGEIKFGKDCFVLLNDGLGTKTRLETRDILLTFYSLPNKEPKNELEEILKKDNILPEFFEIFLVKEEFLFGGKYFISFLALDFQSGISHYEIQEGNGIWKKTKLNFYLLEDQTLKKEIKVKAVDKAGNERISILEVF